MRGTGLTFRWLPRLISRSREWVMDAKYNHFIDSFPWRVALNLAGFGLWLGLAYALMHAAQY